MKNRTYRYMKEEALYPFGFGLSYTKFEFGKIKMQASTITAGDSLKCSVEVRNT